MVWKVADYCGLQIITYAVLSNHLHVLVRVPAHSAVSDEELLRRYSVLFPERNCCGADRISHVRELLTENTPEAELWRKRQLARMGDVSQFMKLLKQRYSVWYNRTHGRFGTLWAERFKSILVENVEHVLATIAAYIDLNGVRAGLASDPKDYRFCGYAEAVAGSAVARTGLRSVFGSSDWSEVQRSYRLRLFASGSEPREGKSAISPGDFAEVVAKGGALPLAAILRCRVKYFSHGGALGGKAFLQEVAAMALIKSGNGGSYPIPALPLITTWGELATLLPVRNSRFE